MQNLGAVIFDLDGTLLDTVKDLTDTMNVTLTKLELPVISVEECKQLVGKGLYEFAYFSLPAQNRQPENVNKLIEEYITEYKRMGRRKTKPYQGINKLIKGLHARNIPAVILSNKDESAVKSDVADFLSETWFTGVYGAHPQRQLKPDSATALKIAEDLKISPARVAFIGDTKTDMQTAKASGMLAIGVLWGFRSAEELTAHGADILVETPHQILQVIDQGTVTVNHLAS